MLFSSPSLHSLSNLLLYRVCHIVIDIQQVQKNVNYLIYILYNGRGLHVYGINSIDIFGKQQDKENYAQC